MVVVLSIAWRDDVVVTETEGDVFSAWVEVEVLSGVLIIAREL